MSVDDARAAARATREQLADTLDQLEDKVNIPKRLGRASKRAQAAYGENPLPFLIAAGSGAVLVVGLVVRAIVGGVRGASGD